MSFLTEFDYRHMHIAAERMPLCVGNLRKIAHENRNWELYHDPQANYCYSIAKPSSGAESTVFGSVSYVRELVRKGWIKPSALTKYGRRLLKV